MNSPLEQINNILEKTNISDFRIEYSDGVNLVIIGSFDLAYYYELKITFLEFSYLCLPTYFNYPFLRMANETEITTIARKTDLCKEDIVYCLEAETGSSLERIPFYIVAEGIEIKKEFKPINNQ